MANHIDLPPDRPTAGPSVPSFIYGPKLSGIVHDSEPDTFELKTWPEMFSDMLREIDVESQPNELGSQDIESGDYYSRHYSQTPRMVTNRGTLDLTGSNIDMVQIIQKG